jgi:hypothetical protein
MALMGSQLLPQNSTHRLTARWEGVGGIRLPSGLQSLFERRVGWQMSATTCTGIKQTPVVIDDALLPGLAEHAM